MKVLVVGSCGMLGQDLVSRLQSIGYSLKGSDLPELDITKGDDVCKHLKDLAPNVVINCAAYTAVDRAEDEPDKAFAVNRDGAHNLSRVCDGFNIPLIHISTDYVFDGRMNRPYREEDAANPLNTYGQSKWEGEEAVRARLAKHLIIRTSWLFGIHGSNFVKTILRLAREREELKVVADQLGCPTCTNHLADAIAEIVRRIHEDPRSLHWGTYHYCDAGAISWHGFAEAIIEEVRRRERLQAISITPCTTDEYPTQALRSKWSVLDCGKIGKRFSIQPKSWHEGLRKTLARIIHEE